MSAIQVLVPDIPYIEGLSFRPIRGEQDAETLYAVHTGRVGRDGVDLLLHHEDMPSLADLRSELSQAASAGENDFWLVAQVHDRVVGYSQLNWWGEEDGNWVYFIGGWVLPEWRGRGLGSAMLHWGEAVARQVHAAEHPAERFEFAANASSSEQDAAALLEQEGYWVAFTTLEMQYDPSTTLPAVPPLPQGVELRPLLPEHLPQLVDSVIECYLDAFPGNRYRGAFDRVAYFTAKYQKPQFDPRLFYLAWDGSQVAGQVILVIQDGQVCVDQVSVRPAWRRKGIARALLVYALGEILARGERKIWLDTYAEYQTRAVDLYLELGFYVAKEFRRYRKAGSHE
jgi:ribosomal protein S18 acetylase RimI-like enzyme